jgi:Zn-finger nucleic acid-binding protein
LYTAFSNPVYKGVIFSPKWGIEKKGAFEPLVSEDTFWRVQMVMSGKSPTAKPHHRANPDFPLRRFIVCEHCRGSMTGSFSKGRRGRYPYYHCPRCKGVGVRREQLEGMFLEMLHTVAFSPEKLNTFENVLQERWKDRHEQTRKQRVLLEQHQKEVQGRRARLDEAFIYEKAIDKHLYDEHRTKLQEEADRVRQQISELEFAKLDVEGLFDFARASLTHPETTWQGMDYYQRQRF